MEQGFPETRTRAEGWGGAGSLYFLLLPSRPGWWPHCAAQKVEILAFKVQQAKGRVGHLGPSAVSGDMKGTRGDLRTWGNLVLLVSAPRQGQGARVLRG